MTTDIERFWEKVEKSDTCWIWKAANTRGYGVFRVNGKNVLAHRFSFEHHKGEIQEGCDIDHKCCNRGCVNPEHLRMCTRTENIRGKLFKKNKTGYKGVYKNKKRFSSMISLPGGVRVCLGTFDTPQMAHKAYCDAAIKYFGEFANDGNGYI